MYKVMLLDDEPWELRGMKNMIPWEKHGFQVVYTLSNPLEALEILEKEPIDVLVSDIRMPALDGISLMKRLREQNINIEILFLSGYAEFDYARDALRSGAFDYLLKPIDLDTIDELLNRLFHALKEKSETQSRILRNKIENKELTVSDVFTDWSDSQSMCVLVGGNPLKICFPQEYAIEQMLITAGPDLHIHLIKTDSAFSVYEFMQNHYPGCQLGISPFVSVKDWKESPDILTLLYQQALSAYHNNFLTGVTEPCLYYASNPDNLKEMISSALSLLSHSDCSSGKQYIDSLPNLVKQYTINLNGLITVWNQLLLHYGDSLYPYEEYQISDVAELVERFRDVNHLSSELYLILEANWENIATCPSKSNAEVGGQDTYDAMISYVNEHYKEPITLQDVADYIHVSFTYASKLFKKYGNTNYSKYLTQLRIKQACRLLVSSNYTIEEICYNTGYQDYFYFNKTFKKHTGFTPHQYRKQEVDS